MSKHEYVLEGRQFIKKASGLGGVEALKCGQRSISGFLRTTSLHNDLRDLQKSWGCNDRWMTA